MKQITHIELKELIKHHYKKKISLMVFGAFGIGKSFVVVDSGKELAKEEKRIFVEWNKITKDEKEDVIKNPEKYFCVLDFRLSEFDCSDLKLPELKADKDTFDWKIPTWADYISKKDSAGILFFDEFNLASPLVLAGVYKIIYDRCIDTRKVTDDWLIMGAGNREGLDMAFTHTIPAPLKDRCSECELLKPNIEDWTNWASVNGIDGRIITFLNFKPSNLHKVDYEDNQKFVTERSWQRVSTLIKGITDWKTFELVGGCAIGEGTFSEFIAFCKLQEKMKLDEIIKNPEKIKEIKEQVDVCWLLVGAVAERYKDKKIKFDKLMEICRALDKNNLCEFVTMVFRLSSGFTKESGEFRKDFMKEKEDKFLDKYCDYLI